MGSRADFAKLKLEDIQKLLGLAAPMMATPTREPATEAQARESFAREAAADRLKPKPREEEVPAAPPGAGSVVGKIPATQIINSSPEVAAQAAPTIEDLLKVPAEALPTEEQLASLNKEEPWVTPELRGKLDKYAQTFKQADMSPWAALADKWSGGGTHLADIAKAKIAAQKTTDLDKQAAIGKRQEDRQAYDLESTYSKELSKTVEPYYKIAKLTIPQLYAAITPDANTGKVNYMRLKQVVGQLLKLGGNVGAQSDREAARVDFDTLDKLIESAKVATGIAETAYIKPDTVVPILEFIKKADATWNKVTTDRLERTKKIFIKRGVPEDIANFLAEAQLEGVTLEEPPQLGKKPELAASTKEGSSTGSILDKARKRINSQPIPKRK